MLRPISHGIWQVLRVAARSKGKPLTGRQLRAWPSRPTKNGKFLDQLVGNGLLQVVESHPDPFQATYTLTELGKHAAEYGEYERG